MMAEKNLKYCCAVAMIAFLSTTAVAQSIVDTFDREDGELAGSTTSGGNGVWDPGSTHANTTVSENRVLSSGGGGSGYIHFQPATDKTFSVQASTLRYGAATSNHSQAIGFVDESAPATLALGSCTGTGCWSGLHMAIEVGGDVHLWDNNFADHRTPGGSHGTAGLANLAGGGPDANWVDLKLEIDPVNNKARGYVNDFTNPVVEIDYFLTDTITGVGFTNSSTYGAEWDNFAINAGPSTPVFSRTWKSDTSGDWNNSGNWTPGGIPEDNNQTAVFGDAISESRVVFTEADKTVNAVQFASAHTYAITGTGTINLAAGTVATTIDVFLGDHQFQAAVKLNTDTAATIGAGSSLAMNNLLDLNGNTLTKQGSGTLNINNRLISGVGGSVVGNGGTISGDGTVGGNLSNHAVLAPGNSPGILSVDGNYTQSAGGTLEIELASNGGVAGTDHDRLAVTLAASLDGTLDLQLDGGYTPTIGDSFVGIVTAGALSGKFATASNVVIDGRRGVAVTYTGTTVDAQVGLRGNTDIASGDIDVDTSDLTTSIINFTSAGGTGKAWADGDTDGDGDVDTSDLTTSIINFTSALGTAQAVPEPTSLALLSLGSLLVLWNRKRSRS